MIYAPIDPATGCFSNVESGDVLPAGAAKITAADALMMSNTPYGFTCFKPDGKGGVLLDDAAALAFDVAEAKASKMRELNEACRLAITGGFQSSALGSPYTYDSTLEDQLNLEGLVSRGLDTPFRCTDAAGVKSFVPHTAAQLLQVKEDGVAYKMGHLVHCDTLKAQVNDKLTDTVAKVKAIAW